MFDIKCCQQFNYFQMYKIGKLVKVDERNSLKGKLAQSAGMVGNSKNNIFGYKEGVKNS